MSAPAPVLAGTTDKVKAWKNLQAECLLAGLTTYLTDNDAGRTELIVSWRSLTKSFDDLSSAQAWLRRFRGQSA